MGREIKRVPLDFKWPLDKIWEGYRNPHYVHCRDCPTCAGKGSTPQVQMLERLWYGQEPFHPAINGSEPFTIATPEIRRCAERNVSRSPEYYGIGEEVILKEGARLSALYNAGWSHHLSQVDVDVLWKEGRLKGAFKKRPTARMVNAWSLSGFGHDSLNQWYCTKARCKAAGWPTQCPACRGSCSVWDSIQNKRKANRWKPKEPPKGDGYQLWETVSEGSPISPVFAEPSELAEWLATSPDYTWRKNDEGTTAAQWLTFIMGPGWAPSMIMKDGHLSSGVQAVCST
jgi:hypothetical protein